MRRNALRVDLGLSPAQALLTNSQGSAKLLGIDAETGTLEAGKFADTAGCRVNLGIW